MCHDHGPCVGKDICEQGCCILELISHACASGSHAHVKACRHEIHTASQRRALRGVASVPSNATAHHLEDVALQQVRKGCGCAHACATWLLTKHPCLGAEWAGSPISGVLRRYHGFPFAVHLRSPSCRRAEFDWEPFPPLHRLLQGTLFCEGGVHFSA
jgi:hypothetical protein